MPECFQGNENRPRKSETQRGAVSDEVNVTHAIDIPAVTWRPEGSIPEP